MRSSYNLGVDSLSGLGMHGVSLQMKRLHPHHRRFLPFLAAAGCLLASAINLTAAVVTDKPSFTLRPQAGDFIQRKLAPLPPRPQPVTADPRGKPAYSVSSSVLERYVGKYSGGSGRVISIVRDGDHLQGDISAGWMQTLTPTAEHEFLVAETRARVVFAKLDSGKAAQYTLELEGERRVYRRLDAADEVPPKLPDYVGHYRSEELETSWSVQVKEGRLVLQQRRHGEIPLGPSARDRFSGSSLGSLQFERDSGGKVTGFKVTTGRVRNLRFDRQLP